MLSACLGAFQLCPPLQSQVHTQEEMWEDCLFDTSSRDTSGANHLFPGVYSGNKKSLLVKLPHGFGTGCAGSSDIGDGWLKATALTF